MCFQYRDILLYYFSLIDHCNVLTYDNHITPAQIYNNSEWYYICAEGFNNSLVDLLCRSNNKKGGNGYIRTRTPSGSAQRIYPYSLHCSTSADSICDCTAINNTDICTDSSDIVIPLCYLPGNDLLNNMLINS